MPTENLRMNAKSASPVVGFAVLLLLGLGTRLITIPLMIVMMVAIFSVHLTHGFEAGEYGFEIPLYYLLMLLNLLT